MLAIDVGNTYIKAAMFDGPEIEDILVIPTAQCQSQGTFLSFLPALRDARPQKVAISSVRQPIREILQREFEALGVPPLVVDIGTEMGIANHYRSPATLGIDRLVNAAAAFHLYGRGDRPLIVIDMGTATTIDYVGADGAFLGGAIAPGLLSAYQGLRDCAPALPAIEIAPTAKVIGQTTHECMASGAVIGHAAMVREMVALMAGGASPLAIITGGVAPLVESWFRDGYIVDRDLTLQGLRIIYEINAAAHGGPGC